MIRIAITPAAYDAIHSTLPKGARLWPVQRQGSPLPHPRRGGRRRPPAGPPCALSPTLPMGARGADFSAPQRVCASKQRNEFGLTMDAGLAEYQFQIAANCLGGQSEFGREPAHRLPFENPPPLFDLRSASGRTMRLTARPVGRRGPRVASQRRFRPACQRGRRGAYRTARPRDDCPFLRIECIGRSVSTYATAVSTYATAVGHSIGSMIDGSSFSSLLTRVEIGQMRIGPEGNGRINTYGSWSSLSQRA